MPKKPQPEVTHIEVVHAEGVPPLTIKTVKLPKESPEQALNRLAQQDEARFEEIQTAATDNASGIMRQWYLRGDITFLVRRCEILTAALKAAQSAESQVVGEATANQEDAKRMDCLRELIDDRALILQIDRSRSYEHNDVRISSPDAIDVFATGFDLDAALDMLRARITPRVLG